jgi:hypothetical protein
LGIAKACQSVQPGLSRSEDDDGKRSKEDTTMPRVIEPVAIAFANN